MLERVRVVLVKPKGSGNIGSVARAMKNMGLTDLVIVGSGRTKSFLARAMAVHAKDLLNKARRFDTLSEAVADCGLVVGTTCRGGLYRRHSRSLRSIVSKIVAVVRRNPRSVALVFGPEDHGLSNQDLKYCHWLTTIPTHPDYPSLNIAQAVMVCLYELFLACQKKIIREKINRTSVESLERLFEIMKRALINIGFLDSQNPEHILLALRRILGRGGLEDKDVRILTALFRQIEWYGSGGWNVIMEKQKKGLKLR